MPCVRDVIGRKSGELVTTSPDELVVDAARRMNERGIGGLPVTQDGALIGIVTERDVLRRVVAERRDPATTTVREVMTTSVLTISPTTDLEECAAVMTARRIRHLPVIGDAGLCGIVTIGDVMAFRVAEQQTTIEQLNNYVFDMR
jgi:CBS domain-containing protein